MSLTISTIKLKGEEKMLEKWTGEVVGTMHIYGISSKELAKRMNIAPQYLSVVLNGKKKPIPVIVNSINSGTSFMNKQPFVRKAANNGGKKAMEAMKKVIETEFEALTKK